MKKYKFFLDYEKEEKWLNSLAKQGQIFTGVNAFGRYSFMKDKPADFNYRLDYRIFNRQSDFMDYCMIFEDSGWKHIAGSKYSGTQYFVKMNKNAGNDIFSDNNSKAGRYKRLSHMWLSLFAVYLPLSVAQIGTGNFKISAIMDPSQLYYTPGLWEMSGARFWCAFLFETPFAMGRGFSWLLFPFILIVYLYFAYRSHRLYNENLKKNLLS